MDKRATHQTDVATNIRNATHTSLPLQHKQSLCTTLQQEEATSTSSPLTDASSSSTTQSTRLSRATSRGSAHIREAASFTSTAYATTHTALHPKSLLQNRWYSYTSFHPSRTGTDQPTS
eukprot:7201252-Pyramimonas_sp.AAC.1